MKKKLSIKVIISLVLSAVLFTMPIGAFVSNKENVVDVHAKDMEKVAAKNGGNKKTKDPYTIETHSSDCICEDKCSQYEYDNDCEVCRNDYTKCAYVIPGIKIMINTPSGWHKDTTKVYVNVEDTTKSGNFVIQKVQAKIAQNGSWTDITEDMYVEISENSTIYVQVTDQKGKTYERNRYIKCFDFNKPTLNAAVNDGLLSVQAQDTDSGIKAVYVNGYQFKKLTNGVLNIRLQKFDTGYQYFTIQAMDKAGNMSEVYKTANPYYTDPKGKDSNEKNTTGQLPSDAKASKPSSATAQVTEHTKTDGNGNTISQTSIADIKKQAMERAASVKKSISNKSGKKSKQGKEFYTIQTANEKIFYLVIDRDGDEEKVYFLTEVSENDLLNTTSDTSETLPQNSAALESAIPVTDEALSNNNTGKQQDDQEGNTKKDTKKNKKTVKREDSTMTYLMFVGLAVVAIGAGYYFKVVRKKKELFLDEDDEEDEEEEVFEDDEDESDNEDDFFAEDDIEEDE